MQRSNLRMQWAPSSHYHLSGSLREPGYWTAGLESAQKNEKRRSGSGLIRAESADPTHSFGIIQKLRSVYLIRTTIK